MTSLATWKAATSTKLASPILSYRMSTTVPLLLLQVAQFRTWVSIFIVQLYQQSLLSSWLRLWSDPSRRDGTWLRVIYQHGSFERHSNRIELPNLPCKHPSFVYSEPTLSFGERLGDDSSLFEPSDSASLASLPLTGCKLLQNAPSEVPLDQSLSPCIKDASLSTLPPLLVPKIVITLAPDENEIDMEYHRVPMQLSCGGMQLVVPGRICHDAECYDDLQPEEEEDEDDLPDLSDWA